MREEVRRTLEPANRDQPQGRCVTLKALTWVVDDLARPNELPVARLRVVRPARAHRLGLGIGHRQGGRNHFWIWPEQHIAGELAVSLLPGFLAAARGITSPENALLL